MKKIIDDVHNSLSDASNRLGAFESEEMSTRLSKLVAELEKAIDAAMAISVEIDTYLNTDHEQAALDYYWDQRIDEARGK